MAANILAALRFTRNDDVIQKNKNEPEYLKLISAFEHILELIVCGDESASNCGSTAPTTSDYLKALDTFLTSGLAATKEHGEHFQFYQKLLQIYIYHSSLCFSGDASCKTNPKAHFPIIAETLIAMLAAANIAFAACCALPFRDDFMAAVNVLLGGDEVIGECEVRSLSCG